MASNNPNHPLQPPPAGKSGGGGIGRSAPIRTFNTAGIGGGGPPGAPVGIASTPPLVKSKLSLTPARGQQQQQQQQQQQSSAPRPVAYATNQATYAPKNATSGAPPPPPVRPLSSQQQSRPPQPPSAQQPPAPPPLPSTTQYPQNFDPFAQPAPITPRMTNDPIAASRITPGTSSSDPVVLARQSPGDIAGKAILGPDSSAQLQPHIVSLPPPAAQQTAATFSHPLENTGGSQKQQQVYQQPQPQQQSYQTYAQQNTTQLKQPYPLTQQPPQKVSSPTKQPQQQPKPKRSTVPSSPDEEVDAFLRAPKSQTSTITKLHPSPLPPSTSQSLLLKSKILAQRRAWGDVIRVTNDALLGQDVGGGGAHCRFYTEILNAAKAPSLVGGGVGGGMNNSGGMPVTPGSDAERLRKETSELIALRFVSQIKLRRYVDLGKEVGQLGLMPHLPDHSDPSSASSLVSAVPPSPRIVPSGSSSMPPSPGTVATESSIDMISSTPVNSEKKQSLDAESKKPNNLAWKEGSIHSTDPTDKLPSWVPFGLRILAAQQLQYNDGSSKAIDVLYDLRDRTVRTEYWNTQGMEIWRPAIDNALVNAFVRKREWRSALRVLEDMLNGLSGGVAREVEYWCTHTDNNSNSNIMVSDMEKQAIRETITSAARVELLSRQLLILLQSGALAAAETIQNEIRLHVTEVESLLDPSRTANFAILVRMSRELAVVRQVPLRRLVNEGLILFARMEYNEAAGYFRDALVGQRELLDHPIASSSGTLQQSQNSLAGCPTWKDLSSPTLGFDADPSLTVECLNNLSLCLLYSGNMCMAVQELEGLIRQDPCLYLTEGVAFNLCTLYELGSDGEECTRKKKLLQRVAKRFYLHDVGVESFRLG